MKVAFSSWNNRIAPVFDVARHVLIVDEDSGSSTGETAHILPDGTSESKATFLAGQEVEILVCGAISLPVRAILVAHGIRVVPFQAGELREVIQGWLSDRLESDSFFMPGCCGRGRARFKQEGHTMRTEQRGKGQGGGGRGSGQGGGPGRDRMGKPFQAGPTGECVCPNCGERMSHERGVPCLHTVCPKCGAQMSRQP
jgi:predicted Fe-Mo cluster-binding NifX family protein